MIKRYCIQSELDYSCALGAHIECFGSCLALINTENKILGDYNRVFVTTEVNIDKFCQDVMAVQKRFVELQLPNFTKVETFPDIKQGFIDMLRIAGYAPSEHTYFVLQQLEQIKLNSGIITIPSPTDYMQWYEKKCRGYSDFEEDWWAREKISRISYIETFRPYWFFIDDTHVGYMDCAELDGFTCIHDVNIYPEFRGKGYGLEMNYKVINNKQKPVVGSISRKNGKFYEKLGFEFECATYNVNIEQIKYENA